MMNETPDGRVLTMFSPDRHQEILNIIKIQKTVKVSDLSKKLFISEATIRRDLEKLEQNGLIRRVYGGAVLLEGLDRVSSLAVREYEQEGAKSIIGMLASTLVSDNSILYLDSGSTIIKMVSYLTEMKSLTVITTSPKLAVQLGETHRATVYCTGGHLQESTMTFVGEAAKRFIAEHNADLTFISCRGLSIENGVTEFSDEVSDIKRLMIRHSKKTILLCDSTKFDKSFFSTVCLADDIDMIVTNEKPDPKWIEFLDSKDIMLIAP